MRAVSQADCVLWTGVLNNRGYGVKRVGNTTMSAARAAWIEANGPLPHELVIDHLCRNPRCINLDHLEPVTYSENTQRAPHVNKTHCVHGHELTGDNVHIQIQGPYRLRSCKICRRESRRRYQQRQGS